MDPLGILTGPYTLQSLKPCDLSTCTKRDILEYFENSYSLNESIFTSLKNEEVFKTCPDRLRLPLIFYFAHTATVYVNKLMLANLIKERIDMDFETIFETGVDEMSWDDTENYLMGGSYQWPSLKDVVKYRLKARQLIRRVITDTPLELPVTMNSPWWALFMGIDHERIHIETSSVLIRQLPIEMVRVPKGWKTAPRKYGEGAGKNMFIDVAPCELTIGKPLEFPSYGWDNEYPQKRVKVPTFEATKYLITNLEFLKFVEDGGYRDKQLWSTEGWKWRCYREAKHPPFWVCTCGCKSSCGSTLSEYSHCMSVIEENGESLNGQQNVIGQEIAQKSGHVIRQRNGNGHVASQRNGNGHVASQSNSLGNGYVASQRNGRCKDHESNNNQYRYRTMFQVINLPLDWPVHVNYHEAKAYCKWRGCDVRVPTEAEHHVMRGTQVSVNKGVSCDVLFADDLSDKFNSNMTFGSSTPVNMFPASETGIHDTFGNVWEWVEDNFNGFPGNQSHPYYDDFSTPTYDGLHNMIMGGSWVSTGQQASRFGRFSFRRHFIQHLGFRIVRNTDPTDIPTLQLVNTKVHVIDHGVEDNPCLLPVVDEYHFVPSTNTQYVSDGLENLNNMLHEQYSFCTNNYYGNLAASIDDIMHKYNNPFQSALVVGCATGRLAFDMARSFSQVVGIDFSSLFLEAAINLKDIGTMDYPTCNHTDTVTPTKKSRIDEIWGRIRAIVPDEIDRSRVIFKQLTWIPNELRNFDLVVLDFLDRTMNKKAWLLRLWEIIRPSGLIIITSSTGWDEDKLQPVIGSRLHCVESTTMMSDKRSEDFMAKNITIWKLKN